MKLYIATLTAAILIFSSLAWSADNRRDGNWWIGQENITKVVYLVGSIDGIELGHRFSCWNVLFNETKADQSCYAKVTDSFTECSQKYLSNVKVSQVRDGLDSFYADYKNRRIPLYNAVWVVVRGIAGTPEEELNIEIEFCRQDASK